MDYEDQDHWWQPWEDSEELALRPAVSPGKRTLTMSLPPCSANARPAPGKRTLTMSLPPRSASAQQAAQDGAASVVEERADRAGAVPYQDEMEAAFDQNFSSVQVGLGQGEALDRMGGAEAAATGESVLFRDREPGKHVVAHELAHVVQQRRHGSAVQARGGVSRPGDAAEQEADDVAARVVAGERVAVRQAPTAAVHRSFGQEAETGEDSGADAAEKIYEAFHGSMFSEEEEDALAEIRGQSVSSLRKIRDTYLERYKAKLEEEFQSYCSDAQAAEAMALLWPAMDVIARLEQNLGVLDDNEDGMMQVLRTASRQELDAAARDSDLQDLLDELDDDQQYEARKLLWPDKMLEHVAWRIEHAEGWINDDESAVYDVILDLTPGQRLKLWQQHESRLSFLSAGEKDAVRRMCVGDDGKEVTEASALETRMEVATAGAGTDDEGVSRVVGRTAALAREERQITHALETGQTPDGRPLTEDERDDLQTRLKQLGGIEKNLLTPERDSDGALAKDSFLDMLHDDVSSEQFASFGEAMGVDALEQAKQRILDAVDVINDDEDAIHRVFRDLHAPVTLPPGRTATDLTPEELERLRAEADADLRRRLREDSDLDHVWEYLNDSELAEVDDYASGDTYRIAVRELEDAYGGADTDEARIFRIVAGMSETDRTRMQGDRSSIYGRMMSPGGGLSSEEKELLAEVFRTGRVPTDRALDVAMGGWGDGTNEDMVFDALGRMSDAERQSYRVGYYWHKKDREGSAGELDEDGRQALEQFRALYDRLTGELDDEDLDQAMERLLGVPTADEILSAQGRKMAAAIMSYRQQDRLELSGGLTDAFTSTDDTAEQAALIFDAHYRRALGSEEDIALDELLVLAGLDAEFNQRFNDYQATVEIVSSIASTVASVVAAIIIVVVSEGALAPVAADLISSCGGATLWAAVASATAKVATAEAFGGDFYQAMSAEGGRDALVGAIEGAMAVAASALAARAARFIGLGDAALSAQITRAALDSTKSGLSVAGRGFARGGLEAAIDGFVGGAVGELVMTATDAETWKRSTWEVLGQLGMSFVRGGVTGAGAGLVTGGALESASAYMRLRSMRALPVEIDEGLGTGGQVDFDLDDAGGVSNVRLRLGPDISEADIQAHVEAALAMQSYGGMSGRVREALRGLRSRPGRGPGGFPPGSRAFEAEQELIKLDKMIEERLRSLQSGRLDPESAARLQAEIDVFEDNVARFREVVEEMELGPGTGTVGQPDAPDGYPDPPDGHHYYQRDGEWDIRRNPEADVKPQTIVPDGQGGFRVVPREGAEPPAERFVDGASKEEAFEMLAGSDSRSSFKAYFEMLSSQEPPIATREDIIAAMRKPGGETVDLVRHELKQRFRDDVINRMLYEADGTPLDDVASHARMREMTAGLNSSDKGNLTEAWYVARHAEDAATHVRIPASDVPGADMDRVADVVHDGAIRELKSGEGTLSAHDKAQFEDYMRFVIPDEGASLNGMEIDEVVYVFTSPQGARANLEWMEDQLEKYANLSFEVFNAQGSRQTFGAGEFEQLRRFLE